MATLVQTVMYVLDWCWCIELDIQCVSHYHSVKLSTVNPNTGQQAADVSHCHTSVIIFSCSSHVGTLTFTLGTNSLGMLATPLDSRVWWGRGTWGAGEVCTPYGDMRGKTPAPPRLRGMEES